MSVLTLSPIDREAEHAAAVRKRWIDLLTRGGGSLASVPGVSAEGVDRFRTWQARISVADLQKLIDGRTRTKGEGDTTDVLDLVGELRMVAALLPPMGLVETAQILVGVLGNPRIVSAQEVAQLLVARAGHEMVGQLQQAWRLLVAGHTAKQASDLSGASLAAVKRLSYYWGVREFRKDERLSWGLAALESGWSVTDLAAAAGVSRSFAYAMLADARAVLAELDGPMPAA